METGDNLTNQELNAKVDELTKRVNELERKLALLSAKESAQQVANAQAVKPQAVNTQTVKPQVVNTQVVKQQEVKPTVEGSRVLEAAVANKQTAAASVQGIKAEKNNKNVESRIGKNLMAVVAAVLILFSLILFGGLILPYITSTVRYIIMLALSLAFSVVGISRMEKGTRLYGLFSAVAAVGVSGFYITNLIGYFGFHMFSEVPLMLLIIVWLVATMALARLKSRMFICISNIGLIISSILATVQWSSIYMGICVYFVGLIVLYLMNKAEDYNKDAYIFLQFPVMMGFFVFSYYETWQLFLWTALAVIVYLLPLFLYEMEKKHEAFLVVGFVFTTILTIAISIFLLIKETEYGVLFTIVMLVIAVVVSIKKPGEVLVYITHYAMMISLLGLNIVPGYRKYLGCLAIAVVLLVLGYVKDSNHIKYPGFAYLMLAILWHPEFIEGFKTIAIIFAVIIVLFIMTYRDYTIVDKYLCTALMAILEIKFFSTIDVSMPLVFLMMGALCLYVNSKLFVLDYDTQESELGAQIVSYVFMGIMLFVAAAELTDRHAIISVEGITCLHEGVTTILVILMSLALCTMNVRRILLSKLPIFITACYNCLKYTILMLLILIRFDVAGFVLTLCTLLFAIGCIILGFIKKFKPFRIYGLVITLVSVLKLVLFDIEYDSNLMRPVGFLIAGLLCFGISWGYTRLEKSQTELEE